MCATPSTLRIDHETSKKVASPTLVIWGEQDPLLGKELTVGLDRYVRRPLRIEYLPNAGHWVPQQFPERMVELVAVFLGSKNASEAGSRPE